MDLRVKAIRADSLVGEGSCSSIDECMSDEDLIDELNGEGITDPKEAVRYERESELLWREMGTNASSGEPDCPLVAAHREFEKLMAETLIKIEGAE